MAITRITTGENTFLQERSGIVDVVSEQSSASWRSTRERPRYNPTRRTLRLWDLESGKDIAAFTGESGINSGTVSYAITPDVDDYCRRRVTTDKS
jgi:hypothetical protein